MKKRMKKAISLFSAVVLTASALSAFSSVVSAVEPGEVIYEGECEDFEDAVLWTSIYADEFPGYSGEGFHYLSGNAITTTVTAPEEGMYELKFRYVQILDSTSRYQTISVNGVEYSTYFPYADEWTEISFGQVRLKEGENTISFLNKYGYAALDTMTVSKAEKTDYSKASGETCDPDATPETKALMSYLKSVYGSHIISGQQEIYGGGSSMHQETISLTYNASTGKLTDSAGNEYTYNEADVATADDGSTFVWNCVSPDGKKYGYNEQNRNYSHTNYDLEFDYIYDLSGAYPAVRGFDIMNYNPLYGWDDGTTERAIDWVKNRGGIATMCWHFNLPNDFTSYEMGEALDWSACSYKNNDTFSVANAVVEGTKENEFLDLCIEDVAEQLLRLQEEGVPVMFRPFHEAEGNGGVDGSGAWFWWAQEGAEAYNNLWKYLYNSLTEDYGLHNLIWVQNLYWWSTESAQWYTGDEYVDIVGLDKYNTVYNRHDGLTSGPNEDAESGIFNTLLNHVDGKKMVAMPENSTVPSLSNIQIEDAGWLYFCIWYDNGQDNFVSGDNYQNPETLKEIYQSDYCITLEELPEDLYTSGGEPSTGETTTETTGETDVTFGDADLSGVVELNDAVKIMCYVADTENNPLTEEEIDAADVYQRGDGVSNMDALAVQKYLAQLIEALPESYL